jgi:uncharacterized protein involved in response to NO
VSNEGAALHTSQPSRGHAPFPLEFVYAALFLGLTVGFGYAIVLALRFSAGQPIGAWWLPLLQAHGHGQLWGWAGLFIMGVSLYFGPRLVGVPLKAPFLAPWICGLLFSGILIRAITQPLIASFREGRLNLVLRYGLGYAALAELVAVVGYITIMVLTIRLSRSMKDQRVLHTFRVYLATVLCGWVISTMLKSGLTMHAALINATFINPVGAFLTAQLYLGLVLLPVSMIFSIQTFPLYLRLPAVRRPARLVIWPYLFGFSLELIPDLCIRLDLLPDVETLLVLSATGRVLKGLALLRFIWELDILLRRKKSWTKDRTEPPGHPVRKQPRAHLPDHGEFGRFEWLLYSAYSWLAVGALLDVMAGCTSLGFGSITIGEDTIRHIYLAGFIMLLLLGMAPRMIPGFMHRRAPAFPGLVTMTVWLGNGAVLFRVLPRLIPPDVIAKNPIISSWPFGMASILGWLAVLLLAWNLTATCGWRRGW